MTLRDHSITLRQMIEFCEQAREVLGERNAEEVRESVVHWLAMTRALELIGEAANRLPPDFHDRYPTVPWRSMINFRHVLIHGYDDLDAKIAVDVVRRDLPPLIVQLRTILDQEVDE